MATQIFDKGYYLFKFYLKSGFHHIEIFPGHSCKYLAFAWDFGIGKFRYFQFCVPPFGLSFAPFIFTKILKRLQKSWRSRGIPIAICLDNGLGGGFDKVSAKIHSLAVHSDLFKSGFVGNQEKSVWEPVQVFTWLGVVRNTNDGSVQATDERIVKLISDLGSLQALSSQCLHVKSVAGIAGQIISLSSCLGSVSRIMTRHLFSVVNSAFSWDSEVSLLDDSTDFGDQLLG